MKPFPRKTPGLWRRVPPAIFPPVMGLFGLGLCWRRAGDAFGVGPAAGDLVLGATTLLFLFAALAYATKVARRPSVVPDDLRILPGRAGLAALSLCVLLLAAALVPKAPALARALLFGGLGLHALMLALVIRALLSGPKEQRHVTPVWHLSFVGFIVAPLSAIPLGETGLARAILFVTIPLALLIWTVSLRQFLSQRMPPPLRPLFAIHLAPASLFAVAAAGLGMPALALGFAAAALLLLMVLVAAGRWLTEAGFSPLWGAFTFPLAAFANAAMAVSDQSVLFWYAGGAALVAASLIVPPIAWKIMQAWSRGTLAATTNAAEV